MSSENKESEECKCEHEKDALDLLRKRCDIYRTILLRYRELIEKSENKTARALKDLVQPRDETIAKLSSEIREKFHPYIYDKNFKEASELAIQKMKEIISIKYPLDFWPKFDELIDAGAADDMDRAILLCSLLRALDCSEVNIYVTDTKKPHILYTFKDDEHLVDVGEGKTSSGKKGEVLKKLSDENKLLYSFNDKEYQDLTEE